MSLRRVILVLALLMGAMLAAAAYRQVTWQRALSAYREGRYREADAAWQRLAALPGDTVAGTFNRGTALYRRHEFEAAAALFSPLTSSSTPASAAARYNLGNCRFRQAETAERDGRRDAASLYRQAADLYGGVPAADTAGGDATHNRAVARQRLARLGSGMGSQRNEEGRQGAPATAKPGEPHDAARQGESQRAAATPQNTKGSRTGSGAATAQDGMRASGVAPLTRQEAEALLRQDGRTGGETLLLRDVRHPASIPTVEKDW